ncbi:hypothetical protein OSTOST_09561, partial [Ostertagia ostertagi]
MEVLLTSYRDINFDQDMPPYMRVVIDVLLDTRRELLDVIKRSDAILEENRKLREENFALKSQIEDLLTSKGIHSGHVTLNSSTQAFNKSTEPFSPSVPDDTELKRSIIISGVPESNS